MTLQLFFGFNCFNPFNNDRATVTLQFSNLVSNVRFSVYDIDDINPQLVDGSVDHVKVTGYNGVNPVDPIIRLDQNTPFNTISGNTVFGWPDYPDNNPINNYPDYFNSGNADNGNADFYFTSPVDRIVIEYEEYVKQLIPSAKKISVPVSPITNEFQWNLPAVPATRSISIGSIGYDYYCPAVLAANFLSFDAKANRIEVNLQWKTANDQQTRQYNIERLMPNGSWKEIGSIMQGQGPLYHYTDKQPVTGINQYRLVLVNTDGTRQFSEIRKVKITCNSNDMEITFNPGASLIVTLYGEARSLSMFNASGQCLFVQPVLPVNSNTGNVRISLDQFHPLPGLYIIKASFVNGEEKTLKFQAN